MPAPLPEVYRVSGSLEGNAVLALYSADLRVDEKAADRPSAVQEETRAQLRAMEVKSAFATDSVCDRSVFASCVIESRTAHVRRREKARITPVATTPVGSLQSGLESRGRGKWPKLANF